MAGELWISQKERDIQEKRGRKQPLQLNELSLHRMIAPHSPVGRQTGGDFDLSATNLPDRPYFACTSLYWVPPHKIPASLA